MIAALISWREQHLRWPSEQWVIAPTLHVSADGSLLYWHAAKQLWATVEEIREVPLWGIEGFAASVGRGP